MKQSPIQQSNNETIVPNHFESLYPDDSRFEEIEQILNFVKEGNCCELIGLPGAGKSNVLGFLAYNRNIRTTRLLKFTIIS